MISQPDRPKGRGKKLEPTPVKTLALDHGLRVEQPKKLRDGAVANQLRGLEIDLAIVVAYGRILPVDVFEAPVFNTWNVHASLLPRFRGASPIQHAILEGELETGVTLMKLSAGMDEGDMLYKRSMAIRPDDTGGSLTERLADLGAQVAVEGIAIAKGDGLTVTPQDATAATYARLLEKTDGRLDFHADAVALDRRVRAFDPWPGTFVPLASGQPLKIRRVRPVPTEAMAQAEVTAEPGHIVRTQPALWVATGAGGLEIVEVQPPGKRPMTAADFLRGAGRHLQPGQPFGG